MSRPRDRGGATPPTFSARHELALKIARTTAELDALRAETLDLISRSRQLLEETERLVRPAWVAAPSSPAEPDGAPD